MPRSRISFKENHFAFELENVEFTVGTEIVKIGAFKGELDVNDLLRTRLPKLAKGKGKGAWFTSFGDKKIQCIKLTRALTGMALKEAKELTESLPILVNSDTPYIEKVFLSDKDLELFCKEIKLNGGEAEMLHDDDEGPTILHLFQEFLTDAIKKGMTDEG